MTETEREIAAMFLTKKIISKTTLTAAGRQVYRRAIAETTATRLGGLDVKADDRRCNSGIFSFVTRPAQWADRVGGSNPCRFLDPVRQPARSAHQSWRIGARKNKPQSRSIAMQAITNIRVTETSSVRVVVSETTPPWFGFSSPGCQTIKVGNLFVTVSKEVEK